jgi:uncharacterized protein YjbI with pentapeptide repeats
MGRCNKLCTKEATGKCALCDVLAERDQFIRRWFKGGLFIDGIRALRQWWCSVPCTEIRHKDVVREVHKQYSETLNKTMLTLLGVALFCLLTTIGSPDKLLLAGDSTIKVPFADTPLSFLGFIVAAPLLLIVLIIYLHVFYGYWLDCERERQYINQRLIPPIEGTPTLFSFPNPIPRMLTSFIFYWLVPLVLGTITFKAWALPRMGHPLTYVSGVVTFILVLLQLRRRPDHQRQWQDLVYHTILVLIIGLMVLVSFTPQSFQRPFELFRAELPKAWLVGIDMSRARADFANLEGAELEGALLEGADLQRANLKGSNLLAVSFLGADLQEANLQGANLQGAEFEEANLQGANLQGADLQGAEFEEANLQEVNFRETIGLTRWQLSQARNAKLAFYSPVLLTALKLPPDHNEKLKSKNLAQYDLSGADLRGAKLAGWNLRQANLQGANLNRANLVAADLEGTEFKGANLKRADLRGARRLSQNQAQ